MSDEFMTDEEFAASLAARSLTQISTSDFTAPLVITVRGFECVPAEKDDKDPRPKWKIHSHEFNRPFIPCVKMRRLLEKAWGKPNPAWMGRKMRLYIDPKVSYGPRRNIGGIRINALSHWAGGPISVEAGRGTEETHRVASLDVVEAKKPEPTHEEKRARLVEHVTKAGKLDDADAAFGPSSEWDAETCAKVAAWLRGGGAA